MTEFCSAVRLKASNTEGVNKLVRGWEVKYGRLRKQYEKFLRNIYVYGRKGDNEGLFEKLLFFGRDT